MGIYIEALVLYVLLFASGTGVLPAEEMISFSITANLARIFLYNIPALALIWYLLLKTKSFRDWGIDLPGKKDVPAGLFSLPALLITGFIIAFATSHFNGTPGERVVYPPGSAPGWIILCVSCISTGYLEESFFRFYLLSKREEFRISSTTALIISTAAFSACHIYEGPWGFLNSVLSGLLLSFVFLRYNSLHGIALAHGLYNIVVYIISAVH